MGPTYTYDELEKAFYDEICRLDDAGGLEDTSFSDDLTEAVITGFYRKVDVDDESDGA
jgi:hypothetical protein